MNPESKLLLDKIQRLLSEQAAHLDRRLADIEKRFADADASLDKCFKAAYVNLERRIVDSKLCHGELLLDMERRHDERLTTIE